MKQTSKIVKMLSQLEDMRIEIEQMRDNKQTSFDSKSERFQESDKGEQIQVDIDNLDDLANTLQNAYDHLENTFEAE